MRTSILVCLCAVSIAACSNGGSVTRSASSPTPDSGQPGQPDAPAFTPFSAASILGDGEMTLETNARMFNFGTGTGDTAAVPASVSYTVENGDVVDASFTIGGETYTIDAADVLSFSDYYESNSAGFRLNSPEGNLMIVGEVRHPELGPEQKAQLEYMIYGVWNEGVFSDSSGSTTRFMSGQATPESAIPTAAARYYGRSQGTGRTATGMRRDYHALLELETTDFSTIDMTLSQSRIGGSIDNSYNASGSGTITGATFTGTLSGNGGQTQGNFDGRFFGPSAEEAGGTLSLTTTAGGSIVGTFVAAQPPN